VALAKFAASDDLGLEFVVVATEEKMLADADFAARADETFPIVRIALQLACEQNFDASLQKISGRRIATAHRLRPHSSTPSIEPRGKHAGIVEDDEIAGAEKFGKMAPFVVGPLRILTNAFVEVGADPKEIEQLRIDGVCVA